MRFSVCATSTWDPEELVTEYPQLYDYDHEAETIPSNGFYQRTFVRLDTLAELVEFINKVGHKIIIKPCKDCYEIEIYDGYRE